MNENLIYIGILIVYLVICFFLLRIVFKKTEDLKKYTKLVIRSFFIALLCGIGIAGGGGEPGFAIPLSLLLSILIDLLTFGIKSVYFWGHFVFIFVWWVIIFLIMILMNIKIKKKRNLPTTHI